MEVIHWRQDGVFENSNGFYVMPWINEVLEYPLLAEKEGIKIRPELMEVDRLYHCVFENAVFIFYKDQEEIMHCYQVDNSDAIKEIVADPTNLEDILMKYSYEKK
jgi:hypothetical protein